jgi:GNAT superfamily N-acetyltransferase
VTDEVTVRGLESPADVRAAMRATRAAWRVAFDHIVPEEAMPSPDPDDEAAAAGFERFRDADDAAYVVADDGDGVVGFALCRWDDDVPDYVERPADVHLQALYVHPDRWGEGVGTALLDAVVERVSPDASRLVLETFTENEHGASFYRARGFEAVGETTYEHAGEEYPTTVWARAL